MGTKKSGNKPKPFKPHPRLTERQNKFVQAFIETRKAREAALLAGYSPKYPDQSAYQALEAIGKKAAEVMNQMGLSVPKLIEKHLVPLLNFNTVKLAQEEGKFTDIIEVADGAVRKDALDIAFRLHGAYAPKEQLVKEASTVRVVVLDAPRPGRPVPAIDIGPNGSKPSEKK